ncbi:hypothetical protein C8R44DRAFT_792945 [Mycena epipterygia]|nr:hypothetical protein C8R44DRAFT_792945 [Mycena epipterygia]
MAGLDHSHGENQRARDVGGWVSVAFPSTPPSLDASGKPRVAAGIGLGALHRTLGGSSIHDVPRRRPFTVSLRLHRSYAPTLVPGLPLCFYTELASKIVWR